MVTMNRNTCVLCSRSMAKNPGLSLHRFPKDIEKRQIWLNACRLKQRHIVSNRKICSHHFELSCYKSTTAKKKYLFKDAVPTIDLKHKMKTFVHQPRLSVEAIKANEEPPKSDKNTTFEKKLGTSDRIQSSVDVSLPLQKNHMNGFMSTNVKDLSNLKNIHILSNHTIGSRNFESSCYKSTTGEKKKLIMVAVPTIDLKHKIKTFVHQPQPTVEAIKVNEEPPESDKNTTFEKKLGTSDRIQSSVDVLLPLQNNHMNKFVSTNTTDLSNLKQIHILLNQKIDSHNFEPSCYKSNTAGKKNLVMVAVPTIDLLKHKIQPILHRPRSSVVANKVNEEPPKSDVNTTSDKKLSTSDHLQSSVGVSSPIKKNHIKGFASTSTKRASNPPECEQITEISKKKRKPRYSMDIKTQNLVSLKKTKASLSRAKLEIISLRRRNKKLIESRRRLLKKMSSFQMLFNQLKDNNVLSETAHNNISVKLINEKM